MIKVFRDQLSGDLCKEFTKELQSSEYVKHMWSDGGEQTGSTNTDFDMTYHVMKRHDEFVSHTLLHH